ncbi:dihydrodipicolinate reductase, domain protein [Mycobacterium xenopi 3993]|nr:dihydrodipicolinate reductase, domain protein [Mycobacterium xenopi 3993]
MLYQLAAGLDVRIDRVEESVERIPAEESFDTPTGHIAAGTIAAMRSTLTGYVEDRPTFVVDHVTRMHDDIAPDWPSHMSGLRHATSATVPPRAAGCTASRSTARRACAVSLS